MSTIVTNKQTAGKKRKADSTPKATGSKKPPPPIYSHQSDLTLTKQQASTGQFKSTNSFRSSSNPTTENYSSGYHESMVVTDVHDKLQKSLNKETSNNTNFDFTYTNPQYGGQFKDQNTISLNKQTAKLMLELGDGFRTDTAQTVLSAPEGKGAGHSGSNMSTSGQNNAHDLLRDATFTIMQEPLDDKKGITKDSLAVLMGANTVSSIAPAKVANTVPYSKGKTSLKAQKVQEDYEARRNLGKVRVGKAFDKLTDQEKTFVKDRSQSFLNSTLDKSKPGTRKLDPNRPSSPLRETDSASTDTFKGGDYVSAKTKVDLDNIGTDSATKKLVNVPLFEPSLAPPTNGKEMGNYFTQVFRGQRRTLDKKPTSPKKATAKSSTNSGFSS